MPNLRTCFGLLAVVAAVWLPCATRAASQVAVLKDLAYKSGAGISPYEEERCKLDLYLPVGTAGFPVVVWFHGGALTSGSKDEDFSIRIARHFAESGLAVALVNYRLSPGAKYPAYVEDAAAAWCWVRGEVARRGGDPERIFVGGHSAGAYLALMIGLDPEYLQRLGSDANAVAGIIAVSGQTMTHYAVRAERGLSKDVIIADEAAPIHYARKGAPPMLVLYGEHDMPARAEENHYLVAALHAAGDAHVLERMVPNRDHGSVAGKMAEPGDPSAEAILAFVGFANKPEWPAVPRFGVNLSGAEFGGHRIPGIFGRDYIYPRALDLDYLGARGRTLFRMPFLWERMQRHLSDSLDADELARLREVLHAASQRGIKVILDPHSYGRYQFAGLGEAQVIGSEAVPVAAFADFWARLATALKGEPAVYAYSLMNEPHDMGDPERWPRAAQAAVAAIRSVDQRPLIFVPVDGWSSARGWATGPNRDLDLKIRDPNNGLVFEAHCYFDKDGSGRYAKSYEQEEGSPEAGVNCVRPFVEWCRTRHVRGFVGEFGVPDSDSRWLVTMDRFLAYLQANGMGATYWSAGPWWGKDRLAIQPQNLETGKPLERVVDRPQMLVLRQFPG